MTTAQQISEAKAGAVELGLDALRTLEGMLPVATPEDLEATASALQLQAIQLRACAKAQRELAARERGREQGRWWMENGAAG